MISIAAFIAFLVGAIIALVDDTPDSLFLTAIMFIGLALLALAQAFGDRWPVRRP